MSTLADLENIRKSLVQQYKNKFELIQIIPNAELTTKADVGCIASTPTNTINLGTPQAELHTPQSCQLLAANSLSNTNETFFSLVENTPDDSSKGLFKCYISDTNPKTVPDVSNATPSTFPSNLMEQNIVVGIGAPTGTRMWVDLNGDVGLYNDAGNLVKMLFENTTRYDCNTLLSTTDARMYRIDHIDKMNQVYPLTTRPSATSEHERTLKYWKNFGCKGGDKPAFQYRLVLSVQTEATKIILLVQKLTIYGWQTIFDKSGRNFVIKVDKPDMYPPPYVEFAKTDNITHVAYAKSEIRRGNPIVSADNRFGIYPNANGDIELKYFARTCNRNRGPYVYTLSPKSAFVYKTPVNPDSNKLLYNNNNTDKSLKYVPFTDESIKLSSNYTRVGPFAPSKDEQMRSTTVANEKACLDTCTNSETCGHVYFYGPTDGTSKCVIGEASKNAFIPTSVFRPTQLEKDMLHSTLYVRNRTVDPEKLIKEEKINPIVVNTLSNYNKYASFTKYSDDEKINFGMQGEEPYIDLVNRYKSIHHGPDGGDQNVDGFDNRYCNEDLGIPCNQFIQTEKIDKNAAELKKYESRQQNVDETTQSIQNRINNLNSDLETMRKDYKINDKYEFLGIWKNPNTLTNGRHEDAKALTESQANVFVLSTLACASMLVAAVMISS